MPWLPFVQCEALPISFVCGNLVRRPTLLASVLVSVVENRPDRPMNEARAVANWRESLGCQEGKLHDC